MSRPLAFLLLMTIAGAARAAGEDRPLPLERLRLPSGFHISVYARVDDARSMALSPSGTLYVGNRDGDSVYAVRPSGGKKGGQVVKIASGLNSPNGVAFRNGDLYVAEISRVLRFRDIENNLAAPPEPEVVRADYPTDRGHGWKFIAFGPDGNLYVPVGFPCNVCRPDDPIYGTITRLTPDGRDREIFANGIRNTVGFDWDPATRELWFTDNGRDEMGDDIPSDELNKAPKAGMNFGFPYCHQGDLPDPRYGRDHACSEFTPPERKLGPHVAALGMRFYTGTMFPAPYRGRIIIAEHGSWNRTHKIGYRVVSVAVKNGHAVGESIFIDGWLEGERAWGRPVDVQVMPDGALLISDDAAGAIYRVSYGPPAAR